MTTHTDNFNRAFGEELTSAPWAHNFNANGNFFIGNNDVWFVGNPCSVLYTGGTALGNDQRSSVKLTFDTGAGTGSGGPTVRQQTGSWSGYALEITAAGYCAIHRFDSGSSTTLTSDTLGSRSDGDEFSLQAVGSTITAFQNGTPILSTTDANYASGYTGFAGIGDPYSVWFDDFVGTDEVGPAAELEQEGFRFGYDDDAESAHTWRGDQDADVNIPLDENVLLRALVDATGDPGDTAYTLRYQKNGAGGYVPVPVGTTGPGTTPLIESGDATVTTVGTATGTWNINFPDASTGDLLIAIIAWDDSTSVTSVTAPAGPNSESASSIVGPQASASTEMRMQAWSWVATGAWSSGTRAFTPSANETCRAVVFRVPAGEFDAATPIGAFGNAASSATNESSVNSPAFSAGSSDGGGRLVLCYGSDADAITAPASGTSTINTATGGGVGLCVVTRDAAVANSESIAAIAATIASDSWAALGFVVRAPIVTNGLYVAPSANITAGGEATTARLTAPSGKTTSNFTVGRRWDDENGADSIDIEEDEYTEVEWCLRAQAPTVASDYFEFRVYAGSSALDTYTVTPKATVASGEVSGALTATESGSDTAAITGTVLIAGALAATESGSDTAALAGSVVDNTTSGVLDATESGADTAAIVGVVENEIGGGGEFPIVCNVGQAVAVGLSAGVASPITIAGSVGQAVASGLSAGIASTTTIQASAGAAVASGLAANIASPITIACAIGQAEASGLQASVSAGVVIDCSAGVAHAAGLQAGVSSAITLACEVGTAVAAGLQAQVSSDAAILAQTGHAVATGLPATVSSPQTISAGVGQAEAAGLPASVSSGAIVLADVGRAVASGLPAQISGSLTISAGVGHARASGLPAQVASPYTIPCGLGAAVALGLTANVSAATTIVCGVGAALAAGMVADIDAAFPAAPEERTYRVPAESRVFQVVG